MNNTPLSSRDRTREAFEEASNRSRAFRFEQLLKNMEKAGISFGMFRRRFTREKTPAAFAWINSGPALFVSFGGTTNNSLLSTALNALKETARLLFQPKPETTPEGRITVDELPVHDVPVSLAVFNELQIDKANLNARLLELQRQKVPDLKSNPNVPFEAQQNQMRDTAFGYGIRIMPDSSIAHCSKKVALLSQEFGPCTSWSRLTGQPHEIISVFDSSAAPQQLVTRFEPKVPQATFAPAAAYA